MFKVTHFFKSLPIIGINDTFTKVSIKIKFIAFVALLLNIWSNCKAQELYGTSQGTIQIMGVLNDSTITAVSKELVFYLNHETAEFELKLKKSTLTTGVDSLDSKLKKLEDDVFVYKGNLGIDYIETKSHPTQNFEVEGYLICAPHNEGILGRGRLEHIFGDFYSCILNMSFHISLMDIGLNIELQNLDDKVHVEIIHAVLKRVND